MKLGILQKMLLYILLPAVIGMAAIAITSNQLSTRSLENQIFSDMQLLTATQSGELENVLIASLAATNTLSEVPAISNFLQASQDNASPETIADLQTIANQMLNSNIKNFTRIKTSAIADLQGKVIANTLASGVGANVANQEFFKNTIKGTSTIISSKSNISNEQTVFVSSAISINNKIAGVVYVTLDVEQLFASTVGKAKIGNTGNTFVLDANGITIMHIKRELFGNSMSNIPWVQQALKEKNGYMRYTYGGIEKFGFFHTMPSTKWLVMIAIDQDDVLSPITSMTQTTAVIVLFIVILIALIIFFIAKNLSYTLSGIANFAQYVSNGNLKITDDQHQMLTKSSHRSDELGTLARAIYAMVENLIKMVKESEQKTEEATAATKQAEHATAEANAAKAQAERAKSEGMLAAADQLSQVVEIITSASTELAAQIEQSERGSSEQASRVTETATAMEEMNSTVLEVAKNSGVASELSNSMRQKAEIGAKIVSNVVASIGQVEKESLALKADMSLLEEQAKSISNIMNVISDIADQTNLLALNAAIEAARAGDAGRGFAVVADEVRKLAEKTMASTSDVSSAINRIQQSTSKSMHQVDVSAKVISETTVLAHQSGQALQEIVTMADNTADQVRAIATAAEQQSATSEEINRALTHVNTIATETSRTMQESAKAVSELANQSQIMNNMIIEMKKS